MYKIKFKMVLTESYMYFIHKKKHTKNTTEQHIFKKRYSLPIHFFLYHYKCKSFTFRFLIGDGAEYIVLTFCDSSYAALSKLTNLEKHTFFFLDFRHLNPPKHTNMPNLKRSIVTHMCSIHVN